MARRKDGTILFVEGAYPQDVVEVQATTSKGGAVFARRFRVVDPSPARVAPPCAFFDSCGGCDLMALEPHAQRQAKLSIVEQALRRTGGIAWSDLGWHASPNVLHYRERIRLHVHDGQLGFYARGSHVLVPVSACLVARPELNDALSRLRTLCGERGPLTFFDTIDLRVITHADQAEMLPLMVHLQPRRQVSGRGGRRRSAGAAQAIRSALPSAAVVCVAGDQSPPLRDHVAQVAFTFSRPGLFSQVNPRVNQLMIEHVVQTAQADSARTFLDLYCGSGNFALPLLARGLAGVGVEFERDAVDLARRACAEQHAPGWGSGQFIAADSLEFAKQGLMNKSYDLVIVDPPRAGAKPILDAVVRATGRTLIMVSCDPVTLARDLKRLVEHGLAVQTISCFDMFPHTHHVETIAILRNPQAATRQS
jgi:23S rRNA (uracil1939-C5)-methyltransferase